jgi:prepilin-type N-terminal cleavage/methylation domain-containing protein
MSGTTSGKLRIRAVAQRMARGESGVTLVEMMVSLFIFAIVVCKDAMGVRLETGRQAVIPPARMRYEAGLPRK